MSGRQQKVCLCDSGNSCAIQSTAVWPCPIPPIHTHEKEADVAETAKKFEKFASVVNGLMLPTLFIDMSPGFNILETHTQKFTQKPQISRHTYN